MDIVCFAVLIQFLLRQKRMCLNLIDSRQDTSGFVKFLKYAHRKVGDSHSTDFALKEHVKRQSRPKQIYLQYAKVHSEPTKSLPR